MLEVTPGKSSGLDCGRALIEYQRLKFEVTPLWIAIVLSFFVALCVVGALFIMNTDKPSPTKAEEALMKQEYIKTINPKSPKEEGLSTGKLLAILICPPTFLIVYFFPAVFHLLRPGMGNKVVGFVIISIFVVLSIIGFFVGLRLNEVDKNGEILTFPGVFSTIALYVSIPLALYSLFLICTIIFHVCRVSAIEATVSDEEKIKIQPESLKNEDLKKTQ